MIIGGVQIVDADPIAVIEQLRGLTLPPQRIPIATAAEEALKITQPSGTTIPWDRTITPYLVEPLNSLSDRSIEAVVFVGPARSGKTLALIEGWLSYVVTCDPGDMIIYLPSELNAVDYMRRRLHRLHANSPQMAEHLSGRVEDFSLRHIQYRNGMLLSLGWPTSTQVAQRDARYVALSDYDSMPDDVGGEGSMFDLSKKRIQTMLSAGRALVESSPKRSIIPSDTQPKGKHYPPFTDGGILTLYARGDRRRWYWRCLKCREPFEAPALPDFDEDDDIEKSAKTARVLCPAGHIHRINQKAKLRDTGAWIPGVETHTAIRSYWLLGCASAFQSWSSLVRNELLARRQFRDTGQEEALKTTRNVDQGVPYLPSARKSGLAVAELMERAEWYQPRVVPHGGRFLHALADVQGNRFVIMVVARGEHGERWIIDRYQITESPTRRDLDGKPQPIDPATHPEDWQALGSVLELSYPLADESCRRMRIRLFACDSGGGGLTGGQRSVTGNAYAYWRKLKARNFYLLKGHPGHEARALVWRTFPESKFQDVHAVARGDVPVHWVNTLRAKDTLDSELRRSEPGPGMLHLPEWLGEDGFAELCAEVRGPRKWEKVGRNENFDLLGYELALMAISEWEAGGWKSQRPLDWKSPPPWAREWDLNSMVSAPAGGHDTQKQPTKIVQAPAKRVERSRLIIR